MISLIDLLENSSRKVGSTWKTKTGKFGGRDIYGRVRYFDTEQDASTFAKKARKVAGGDTMAPGDEKHQKYVRGDLTRET